VRRTMLRLRALFKVLLPRWRERAGAHGETLAAIACGAAIALWLFAPAEWRGSGRGWMSALMLLLITVLLLFALLSLMAAVAHVTRARDEWKKEPAKKYQVTPTRVLVLQVAGVPRDITRVIHRKLEELPENARALPPTPLYEKEFLAWLARTLGLGQTRVEEHRALILKYSEHDAAEGEAARNDEKDEKTAAAPPKAAAPNGSGKPEVVS
jgi:hypothetical protein